MAEMSTGTLSLSDWVSVANLVVALGAMGVAIVALVVARRTLKEAEEDWKQQKWFDLYAKADEAHSLLVRYKKVYPTVLQTPTIEGKQDWNALMSVFLEAYTMAGCFPVNPAVDSLLAATGAFTGLADAYDETRFTRLGDAVEKLRQRALLKPSVLG